MLEISEKTNLLEQKSYRYSLQDVEQPNLQRDIYSYGTVPKVSFKYELRSRYAILPPFSQYSIEKSF